MIKAKRWSHVKSVLEQCGHRAIRFRGSWSDRENMMQKWERPCIPWGREREKTKSLASNVFPVPFPKSLIHTLVPVFRCLCDFTSCPYNNLLVECFSRLFCSLPERYSCLSGLLWFQFWTIIPRVQRWLKESLDPKSLATR